MRPVPQTIQDKEDIANTKKQSAWLDNSDWSAASNLLERLEKVLHRYPPARAALHFKLAAGRALLDSVHPSIKGDSYMRNLRVGCILDNTTQLGIVCDLIDKSLRAKSYSIDLLIVHSTRARDGSLIKVTFEQSLLALIKRAERFLVGGSLKHSPLLKPCSLNDINIETINVNPIPSQSEPRFKYSQEDLGRIRKSNLDILVNVSDGIPTDELLDLCQFGVISVKFSSNRAPGFWEVVRRERSTYFVIERLTGEQPRGDVLFEGGIPTSPFYAWNLARVCLKANYHLHGLLEDLGASQKMPEATNKTPYCYPLHIKPSTGSLLSYPFRTFRYLGGKMLRNIQGKSRRWGVAYQFVADWRSAILCKSTIIRNPPNRFLADPFIAFKDGYHVCLVEDFDYTRGKGKISAFKITADGYTELGTALEESFHLSYPFVFEDRGDLYMCPETSAANDIRLYKCISFPLTWRLHRILKANVSAADTSIFKADGKWWMLTNIDSSGIGEHCSELHLFYADTLDSSEWAPHRLNPIVIDPLRARNGGLLVSSGNIYRVFQTHGFDMYGESMGIAQITKLTQDSYAEECLCTLPAKFFPRLIGAHTYSFERGLLAFDFLKVERRQR